MDALTQSQQRHVIKHEPNATNPVPLRWMTLLSLHLSGKGIKEIAKETGYCENSVYRILNHPNIQYVRQQLLATTQQEFEALFDKVVNAVRDRLVDPDPRVQLEAVSLWLKAHGKGITTVEKKTELTAENIVFQILNGDVNAQQRS